MTASGWFDYNSWWLHLDGDDPDLARFASAHESHHKQLQDSTSFGALNRVVAALAGHRGFEQLGDVATELTLASEFVHEAFATWAPATALGWDQAKLFGAYPAYRRYYLAMDELTAPLRSPYLRFHAVHATSRACMQTTAATIAIERGLEHFELSTLRHRDHPDTRFAALLRDPPAWEAVERALEESDVSAASLERLLDAATLTAEMFAPPLASCWQAANEACYRLVAVQLEQTGSTTLDHEGHLSVTPRLLAAADALIPGRSLGLEPGNRRDPDRAPAIVLRNIESEGFALAEPLPAAILPSPTSPEALIADMADPHLFVTLRRTNLLGQNYSLLDGSRFLRPVGAFARRTVAGPDGHMVVELLDVTDRSDSTLSGPHPVAITTSMSLLGRPELAGWTTGPALTSTVLIADVALAEHLQMWLALPGVQFHYQLLRVESFGRVIPFLVGRINAGDQAVSNLMVRPLSHAGVGVHRRALGELDPSGSRINTDLTLSGLDQVLISRCLAHLAGEEVRFPRTDSTVGDGP